MPADTPKRSSTGVAGLVAAVLGVVGGWVLTWSRLGSPVAASLAWSLPCFVLALAPLATATRAVWFNVGVVVLLGGAFPSALEYLDHEPDCHEEVEGEAHWRTDADLTYLPPVNASYQVTRRCDGTLIYDARYSTDAYGLRNAGTRHNGSDVACLVLVGGSFAFGEGIDDEETLAHQIWTLTGGAYQVRNFGVPGHGANHVLAMLERGLLERAAACNVRHVLYLAISDHIGRVAGSPRASGDPNGPRYVLDGTGGVRRRGNHGDVEWTPSVLTRAIARTDAARRVYRRFTDDFSEADRELFAAVVRTIDARLAEAYPSTTFHVLWWDHGAAGNTPLPELPGIPVHRVTEILPPADSWEGLYEIARDGHPTALAGRVLAGYVVRAIIGPQRR